MKKRLLTLVVAGFVVAPFLSFGAGLGSVRTYSNLNERLNAEIPVLSVTEKNKVSVALAPASEFSQRGISRSLDVQNLRFSLVKKAERYYVRVNSSRAVSTPYLNFVLELTEGTEKTYREYAIFLDPASPNAKKSQRVLPKTHKKLAQSGHKKSDKRRVMMSSLAGKTGYYGPVKRGETLWSIADQLRPSKNVPVRSVIKLLKKVNPKKLRYGLKSGSMLKIPVIEGHSRSQEKSRKETAGKIATKEKPQSAIGQVVSNIHNKADALAVDKTSELPQVIDSEKIEPASKEVVDGIKVTDLNKKTDAIPVKIDGEKLEEKSQVESEDSSVADEVATELADKENTDTQQKAEIDTPSATDVDSQTETQQPEVELVVESANENADNQQVEVADVLSSSDADISSQTETQQPEVELAPESANENADNQQAAVTGVLSSSDADVNSQTEAQQPEVEVAVEPVKDEDEVVPEAKIETDVATSSDDSEATGFTLPFGLSLKYLLMGIGGLLAAIVALFFVVKKRSSSSEEKVVLLDDGSINEPAIVADDTSELPAVGEESFDDDLTAGLDAFDETEGDFSNALLPLADDSLSTGEESSLDNDFGFGELDSEDDLIIDFEDHAELEESALDSNDFSSGLDDYSNEITEAEHNFSESLLGAESLEDDLMIDFEDDSLDGMVDETTVSEESKSVEAPSSDYFESDDDDIEIFDFKLGELSEVENEAENEVDINTQLDHEIVSDNNTFDFDNDMGFDVQSGSVDGLPEDMVVIEDVVENVSESNTAGLNFDDEVVVAADNGFDEVAEESEINVDKIVENEMDLSSLDVEPVAEVVTDETSEDKIDIPFELMENIDENVVENNIDSSFDDDIDADLLDIVSDDTDSLISDSLIESNIDDHADFSIVEDEDAPAVGSERGIDYGHSDVEMKLAMAETFISVSKNERAKELLEKVIEKGSAEQIEKAKSMLGKIG